MHPDQINFQREREPQMFDQIRAFLNRMEIMISANPDHLGKHRPIITVEAEYGDRVVEGQKLTLAHHGTRSANPAPCLVKIPVGLADEVSAKDQPNRTIGVSHVDLDTVGGLIRIAESQVSLDGWKLGDDSFWELAAYVDLHGAHRALDCEPNDIDLSSLWAWWAWEREHDLVAPRDGSVKNIGAWVSEAVTVLAQIFHVFDRANYNKLHEAGDQFKAAEEELNRDSFVEMTDGVCVRVAPTFVNHLYRTPSGAMAQVVVAYNTRHGSITVSCENETVPLNARVLVQSLWGEKAGGHDKIAGSPRDMRMKADDLARAQGHALVYLSGRQ